MPVVNCPDMLGPMHCKKLAEAEAALAEARAEADDTLLKADEEIKRLEAKLAAAEANACPMPIKGECSLNARMMADMATRIAALEASEARLKAALAEAARMIRALEHRPAPPAPARPDAVTFEYKANYAKPKRKRRRSK